MFNQFGLFSKYVTIVILTRAFFFFRSLAHLNRGEDMGALFPCGTS